MKKLILIIFILFITIITVYLSFGYRRDSNPNTFYKVYLNGEVLGTIKSKSELEKYIDKKNVKYKKQYHTKKIYAPTGLKIRKVSTYDNKLISAETIYQKIAKKASFTISGYQFSIKKEDKTKVIYVTDKKIFKKSLEKTIKTFVGEDDYRAYKNKSQVEIDTTGKKIENVYISDNITIKKAKIPVTEKIYTDEEELSKFLLFGTTEDQSKYIVKEGDTIEEVAFNNQISTEEFLISNPNFTSSKNLLFPGQEVVIGFTDPQVSVVVDEYVVEDKEIKFQTDYQYDENRIQGDDQVIQTGENGLERVSQKIQITNGQITYVNTVEKEELKPSINQVIILGEKIIPSVGTTSNWQFPTNSGYTISSDYVYRINPVTGGRELHGAIDISGTGMGSPIYAATNGVVSESTSRTQDGNYVCINHNNGYYTCYAHMLKRNATVGQVVSRGQVIGYVGKSGYATGPHLHFEVWVGGRPWNGGRRINPWTMLNR